MKTIDDALAFADTFDKPANKYMGIVMLAAEVRRLREENERLRKDAERYQWLRDNEDELSSRILRMVRDGDPDLDSAIDAARGAK